MTDLEILKTGFYTGCVLFALTYISSWVVVKILEWWADE